MPYDPNIPANSSPLSSAVMRGQLTSLKALIDAFVGLTDAVIDGVTTLNPGEPASATASIVGTVLHLTLAIPSGQVGGPGPEGPQGPPFANVIVDSVTTLSPGSPATVTVSFDGTNVHLAFGIPAGQQGIQGTPGADGAPGEVSNAALANAISMAVSGTSNNTNAIATLDTPFADPDAESMRQAHNALVLALRR